MTPSLSLTTDMDTLIYLDSAGKKTTISLTSANGAKVLLENNQIKAVVATSTPIGTPANISTINAQWQVNYNPTHKVKSYVGTTELDGQRDAENHVFDMSGGKSYNLRRVAANLLVLPY